MIATHVRHPHSESTSPDAELTDYQIQAMLDELEKEK